MNQEDDLQALTRILPAPERPVDTPGDDDWQQAEGAVGRPLPPDFKAFVSRYGSGQIDGFLHVLNPIASREPVRLVPAVERLASGFRELRAAVASEVPYPIHPESAGLLPWAFSDNGDVFFWATDAADPADWSIVLAEAGGPGWASHPGPATSFLAELLSRTYRPPFLPGSWPSEVHSFAPYAADPLLERLTRLLPPPERPAAIEPALPRAELESQLGGRLPSDYWAIVGSYGRGTFGAELFVLEPAAEGPRALPDAQARVAGLLRLLHERRPGEVPFSTHPEPGGLLAWGGTPGGATAFWRTVGDDPDTWPIVVRDGTRSEWFTHRGPISWFLSDLADGSIDVSFLPGGVSRLQFRPGE
jgi:hypothetical protein